MVAIVISYALVLLHDFTRIGLGRSNNLFLPTDITGSIFLDIDMGMDFFNSIQYVKGRHPYTQLGTVYPPLANLLYYFLYIILPIDVKNLIPDTFDDILFARATYADLRVHQASLMEFMFFFIIVIFLLFFIFKRTLFQCCKNRTCDILAACFCASIGVLYAVERGNIILLSLLCIMFFLMYYKSDNPIIRELALIALAFAAGLKLYPALFGVVLLADHKYREAIRAVLYGMAAFILPFFVFEGFDALKIYFSILNSFSNSSDSYLGYYGIQANFKTLLYFKNWIVSCITHVPMEDLTAYSSVLEMAQKMSYLIGMILLLFVFYEKNTWRKYMYITVAMLSVQLSIQYTSIYLIIPLIYLIACEYKLTRKNIFEYVLLVVMMLPMPIQLFKIFTPYRPQYTLIMLIYQVDYLFLLIVSLCRGVQAIKRHHCKKNIFLSKNEVRS